MSRKKSIYCIFFTFNTVYCEKPRNAFWLSANRFGALKRHAINEEQRLSWCDGGWLCMRRAMAGHGRVLV